MRKQQEITLVRLYETPRELSLVHVYVIVPPELFPPLKYVEIISNTKASLSELIKTLFLDFRSASNNIKSIKKLAFVLLHQLQFD